MAGVGKEVGAGTLGPAQVGLVPEHQNGPAQGVVLGRQGTGQDLEAAFLGSARGIGAAGLDAAEERLINSGQDLRVPQGGNEEDRRARDPEKAPGGGVGALDPEGTEVIGLPTGNHQQGVGSGIEQDRHLSLGAFEGLLGPGVRPGGRLRCLWETDLTGGIDRTGCAGDQEEGKIGGVLAGQRPHPGKPHQDRRNSKSGDREGGRICALRVLRH